MAKKYAYSFLSVVFIFLSFKGTSQSEVSDYLRRTLANARTPIGRINTYVVIAKSCESYDSALHKKLS